MAEGILNSELVQSPEAMRTMTRFFGGIVRVEEMDSRRDALCFPALRAAGSEAREDSQNSGKPINTKILQSLPGTHPRTKLPG
jgi:hypothetical protein